MCGGNRGNMEVPPIDPNPKPDLPLTLRTAQACSAPTSTLRYVLHKPALPPGETKGTVWRLNATESGGGLFMDVGSHACDLFDFLFGPLLNVAGVACGEKGEVETQVSMLFSLQTGGVGSAVWDFSTTEEAETLEIQTTEGAIRLDNVMNGENIVLQPNTPTEQVLMFAPPMPVQGPLIQTVVNAIRSGDPSQCPSTATTALRTARVLDTVLNAYYGGRSDEFWTRPQTWPCSHSE